MKKPDKAVPNERLFQERVHRNLTQEELAAEIGTDFVSVSRWERGIVFPSSYFRQKLREFFGKSDEELGLVRDGGQVRLLPEAIPLPIWNVPYQHNPAFTGREDILVHLHEILNSGKTGVLTQPQAITGLGGIGKTQTAVEYAYQYHTEYKAVLWIKADTRDTFISDIVNLVNVLPLPDGLATEQEHLYAVKKWLQEHKSWLLIIDNIEDFTLISDFIPTIGQGHILLTTRTQHTGPTMQNIEISKLSEEESALLLLRRSGALPAGTLLADASDVEIDLARIIGQVTDGLPLAIEQAGAYIEAVNCSLSEYLERYLKHRAELLSWRGKLTLDYPESVATTWSLSFRNIEQESPAAADMLRLCAFLYAEAIPEEIVTKGSPHLGPLLRAISDDFELGQIIGELFKYSLIRRNATDQTLTIHRLVQIVLKDKMDQQTRRVWAERVVKAINSAFPSSEDATWQVQQRFLPHAQVCAELIKEWKFTFLEAAQLLYKAGNFLRESGRYTQAEPLCLSSLELFEEALGTENVYVGNLLTNLAIINEQREKLNEAESLYQRAVLICETAFGAIHPDTATALNHLGLLYTRLGKFSQAESLIQHALNIRKTVLGTRHLAVANSLMVLAELYSKQGKHTQAEHLYDEALSIREQLLGSAHPSVANVLKNQSACYASQGRFEESEQIGQRASEIYTLAFGTDHHEVGLSLSNLAATYIMQEKYVEAEEATKRALKISEQDLEPLHPEVTKRRELLARIYRKLEKFSEIETLYNDALAAVERNLGPENPEVAALATKLANIYLEEEKYKEAEPLYRRVLAITEKILGPEDIRTIGSMNNLAALYLKQRLYHQSELLLMKALPICIRTNRMIHPAARGVLENYKRLLRETGRWSDADHLAERFNEIN